jgi:hypothetical protein
MSPRAAAITAVVLLLLPQNLIVMAVIWKDSQMAAFLLASMAALLSDDRRWRVAGCGFLFLATGVRYNAAAATLPILILLWDHRRVLSPWRRWAIAIGLWLGITVSAVMISALLVEERKYPWETSSAPVDLVGTIRFAPKLTDEQILRDTAGVPWFYTDKLQVRTRTTYSPTNNFLEVTQTPKPLMDYIATDAHRTAIKRAWRTLVFAHPIAFLRHRIGVFDAQLESTAKVWQWFVNADWGADLLRHDASYSKIQRAWLDVLDVLAPTELFRVRIYFWLLVLLVPLCWRDPKVRTIATSGLLYELSLFLVAPAIDYRYSHWLVVCAIITLILTIKLRRHSVTQG